MRKLAVSLAKTAVYTGLTLGLALGGGMAVVAPTTAFADVVSSDKKSEISIPKPTMTDPSEDSGQALVNNIYNKEFYTIPADGTPNWVTNDKKTGQFTMYLTVKGYNGQTYYSWAGTQKGVDLRTIFDQANADPDTYELHVVYKNGNEDTNPLLLAGIGSPSFKQTLLFDSSRNLIVRSASGTAYKVQLNNGKDGNYYNPDDYNKEAEENNRFDDVARVFFNTSTIKANDMVEAIIPIKNTADATKAPDVLNKVYLQDFSEFKGTLYNNYTYTSFRQFQWDKLTEVKMVPVFWYPEGDRWATDAAQVKDLDPYPLGKIADAMPDTNPNGEELQSILHFNMVGLTHDLMIGYSTVENGVKNMKLFGFYPLQKDFEPKLDSIYSSHQLVLNTNTIESDLKKIGWTVEFRGHNTKDSVPTYFYSYGNNNNANMGPGDVTSRTTYTRLVSVIPAILRAAPQTYWTLDSTSAHDDQHMPENWTADQLLLRVYHADEPLEGSRNIDQLGHASWMQEYDKKAEVADGTIDVVYKYHEPGQTDDDNVSVKEIDRNKAGVYKVTFTRTFGKDTPISTYQYVYINKDEKETKTVTRTIVEHTPTGNVETTQPVTLTRTVSTDAKTGEKSYSDWSTGTWDAHTAKAVDGWTADKNADKVTVTSETEDARVDIYYTRPVSEEKTITRTIFVHQPDGQTPETKQVITLKRDGTESTTDEGSTTTWNDWNEGAWDAFPAPKFEGWTADKNVDAQTVTHETADVEEHIHYSKVHDNVEPGTPGDSDKGTTDNPGNAKTPETMTPNPSSKDNKGTAATPKTGDVATAVVPVAAIGFTALFGSLLARKRRK